MTTSTTVDSLHKDFSTLLSFLDKAGNISLRGIAEENLRKTLLMAIASYFEHRLKESVVEFAEEAIAKNHILVSLTKNKAVERQYHTWFDWNEKNANQFFSLFGGTFKDHIKAVVDKDTELKRSIEAFMEIGQERNRLVHQNFGSYSLEKTVEEVYKLYESATKFVDWFPDAIREYSKRAG